MARCLFLLVVLTLVMSNSYLVNADEGHHSDSTQNDNHVKNQNETNLQERHHDSEKEASFSKSDVLKDSQNEEEAEKQHNEGVEGVHQEFGHDDAIQKESSANIKVLSLFGLLNMSFILFGLWNKWIKRQEA